MPDEKDKAGDQKKQKKQVPLKQYLVSGAPEGAQKVQKAAFIMHTCPSFAKDEFRKRFPDCRVWHTSVTAESSLTKEDLLGRDFWAEKLNWVLIDRKSDDEPLELF